MANSKFTEEFLNEVASNYHTVAEASRDLKIPYTKLRNALIKNGNLIPKTRRSLQDKDDPNTRRRNAFIKISIECSDEFFIPSIHNLNNVSYKTIEDALLSRRVIIAV